MASTFFEPISETKLELMNVDGNPILHEDVLPELEATESFQALPPADRGRQAWCFLAACFCVEALVWGFPFVFGLFEAYYAQSETFKSEAAQIPIIGPAALGILYFSPPFVSWLLSRYPYFRRSTTVVGLAIIVIALVVSSFAQKVWQLIVTQGVLYGIGGVLAYYPVISFVDEWFIDRKGLAFGIMWGGSGAAGIVVPYLMEWLLNSYGFQTTLRVWAVVMVVLTTPLLPFLKPRIPPPQKGAWRAAPRPTNLRFLKTPAFWVLLVSYVLANLGYFVPAIWLPSFVRDMQLSSQPQALGATAIALLNLAVVVGAAVAGALVDRLHVTSVIFISTFGCALAVLVFWGFSSSPGMLYVFALAYGFFGGAGSSSFGGAAPALRKQLEVKRGQGAGENVETGLVIASFAASKGIGAVLVGPLSFKLMEVSRDWVGSGAYGSSYGALVIFTGVTASFGGVGCIGRIFGLV